MVDHNRLLDIKYLESILDDPYFDINKTLCGVFDAPLLLNVLAKIRHVKKGEYEQYYRVINFLIDRGADPNNYFTGFSPLAIAIVAKDLELVKILVERGANINDTNMINCSNLNLAIKYYRSDIFKYLLENGADPNYTVKGSYYPLEKAILKSDMNMICLLIKHGVDMTRELSQNITIYDIEERDKHIYKHIFSKYSDPKLAIYLLNNNFNIYQKNDGYTFLQGIIENRYPLKTIEKVVDNKKYNIDVNYIFIAIKYAQPKQLYKILKLLLRRKIDLNVYTKNNIPLLFELLDIDIQEIDIIELFLENGADINMCCQIDNSNILQYIKRDTMSIKKFTSLTSLCLKYKIDVKHLNNNNKSVLFAAIEHDAVYAFRCLVEAGADINQKSPYGRDILSHARQYEKCEIFMYLFRFNPTEIDISDRMIRRFSNEYKDFFIEYILYQRDHSRYFDKYKKRKYFLKYTDKSFNIRKAEQTKLVKTYDILRSYISEKHIVNIILDYKYDFEYIDFLYTVI